ncbi:MAG: adenosine deaminase [bacterium]
MRKGQYRRSDLLRGERIPRDLLLALPKTDLHCHLDGSLRLETFCELGRQAGLDIPDDPEAARQRYFPGDNISRQQEFLRFFDHTLAVLQEPAQLQRVAREMALDAAEVGCWYLEVRFCPLFHTKKGMKPDDAVAAVWAGLQAAKLEVGIRSGIIITGLRTIQPERSLELAELAVDWQGRGVVAFDLAGAEEHYPAKDHRKAFYHVMNNNLNSTIHAGEGFGPASIHQALHYCGANRIGHGTRLHEDPELLAYVNDHRIPLEVCLSSNVQTGVVPSFQEHPLRYYLDLGLRVTLNTDNTLFARTSIANELELAVRVFDLTLLETENLLVNGFKSAFLPQREKEQLVGEDLKTVASLRDKFALDDLDLV